MVVLAIAVPAAASSSQSDADVSPERMAELRAFLTQDCGSCHGLTRKGGLGSPLTPEAIADRSDEDLALTILHGVPGTPMPPWSALLTEAEVDAIVRMLRNGD
ncbi:Cytochrome c55X precursor NirC [Caenispirillum salinarum AK4]|uniref:Cytochrome c55X NirC n=2 Tax=Caenispirillum TaxID=414051 RepID=K9GSA8_9PROT|nr:Cytochrome c55X precursor NirC [Caenispirillum salinarum AK4]